MCNKKGVKMDLYNFLWNALGRIFTYRVTSGFFISTWLRYTRSDFLQPMSHTANSSVYLTKHCSQHSWSPLCVAYNYMYMYTKHLVGDERGCVKGDRNLVKWRLERWLSIPTDLLLYYTGWLIRLITTAFVAIKTKVMSQYRLLIVERNFQFDVNKS